MAGPTIGGNDPARARLYTETVEATAEAVLGGESSSGNANFVALVRSVYIPMTSI